MFWTRCKSNQTLGKVCYGNKSFIFLAPGAVVVMCVVFDDAADVVGADVVVDVVGANVSLTEDVGWVVVVVVIWARPMTSWRLCEFVSKSNINLERFFADSPKWLRLMSFKVLAGNGEFEYGMSELRSMTVGSSGIWGLGTNSFFSFLFETWKLLERCSTQHSLEESLNSWPPVWLVWFNLTSKTKQLNPIDKKRRSAVQKYLHLWWVFTAITKWIHLHLLSCGPSTSSVLFQFICELWW